MQRRFSVLFMMVALVALLLTGCSTITETVGDQVASVLPTLAAAASLPTSEAVIQPASQSDPTAEPPFTEAEDAAALAQGLLPRWLGGGR